MERSNDRTANERVSLIPTRSEYNAGVTQRVACPKCGTAVEAPDGAAVRCPACATPIAATSAPTQVAEPTALAPWSGKPAKKLGKYDIMSEISRGGMGIIYRARQPELDRVVALKVITPQLVTDQHFIERFLQEARALGKLNHPNIVQVYDVGREADGLFLVMEYVDGMSLRALMRRGRVPPDEARRILTAVCDALEYAHSLGIVHRDIKPENVLLSRRGEVKLADFGLAVLTGDADRRLTATDAVMGTIDYMAPEQRRGTKFVDRRADVYAVGVMLYELLTGEVPIGRFDPPSQRSGVDRRFDPIVMRALEQEPDQRYQRASEVKSRLERIASAVTTTPQPPAPPVVSTSAPTAPLVPTAPVTSAPPPPPAPPRGNAAVWIMLIVGIVLLLGCGGIAMLVLAGGSAMEDSRRPPVMRNA